MRELAIFGLGFGLAGLIGLGLLVSFQLYPEISMTELFAGFGLGIGTFLRGRIKE